MNSVNIGERLTQLRATMAAKSLVPDHWSRTWLAQQAGVSLAALARLEDTGHESAEVLAAVLRFYQNRDVDVAWVLARDNADIPLHGSRSTVPDEKLLPQSPPLADLRRLLPPLMAALDAAPSLPAEDLHAQVTHLQRVALAVLNHLVPPKRVGRTEADLRAWHKFFPPVSADSTGWYPMSPVSVPYHYVEAGAFLARCGEDMANLSYYPVLENISDSDKCGACRSRMDATLPADASSATKHTQ
jgi:hypothetical protein